MKKYLLVFLLGISQLFLAQEDCITAIPVCGNSGITYLPAGTGNVAEGLSGTSCLSGENHSAWYSFTIATAGTLTFLITPAGNVDYDWALYGPNTTCGALGQAIRCSYAGTASGYLTGLNMTATDLSEDAGGDGFVRYLDVLPGQTYYLLVDNFSTTISQFSLTWGGTATLASAFTDPTLTPFPFIAPGPNQDGTVIICTNPALFDFSTLSSGIINGNPNFSVTYFTTSNNALTGQNPVTTPIIVNTANTYYYNIQYTDPANPNNPINKCKNTGTINFIQGAIVVNNATLTACSNNNSGVALYDLTSAPVFADPAGTSTFQYYPSLADLQAGTNEITNPTTYTSAQGEVFVKVTTAQNCDGYSKITLAFYPPINQTPVTLTTCFRESNPTTGLFDLENANVSSTPGVTKKYYLSLQDAINQNNPIGNFSNYIATSSDVYVRVTSATQCWNVVKVTLIVTPPKYSLILKDKVICVEDTTTLDAGPGFTSYLWSTGATTASITNVSVGSYFVDLFANGCVTRQQVKVLAAPLPVVTNIEISNNSVTVTANGGTPPYQYSLDGTNFQDSNVFTNLPRGQNSIYIKDSFNCDPIKTDVTVPNLINAITPNGDGVNDVVDYSSLSYKKGVSFMVYDRYGNKIYQADKNNNYQWDGTVNGGKRVSTGTYWYTITWAEPVGNEEVKYSGWILVKNRD